MRLTTVILLSLFLQISCFISGQACYANSTNESYLFQAEVTGEDINVRTDSTVSSDVICKVKKGEQVDVVSSLYDWYKIRLPKDAPSYIRKDFVKISEDNIASVAKDNVNIRSKPDISSPILGKIKRDTRVTIIEDKGDWYKIEPVDNSFGWINKNFANRIAEKKVAKKENNSITIQGIIKLKTFTRVATYKLIGDDDRIYLLKADKDKLDPFNQRKVRITGKIVDPTKPRHPIIEVEKIEPLD
jgi:uncharacterized protein YgiM (DUF1202 family)